MAASNLSAIVLAGGLSTRMGQDKALISIAGVPLIQKICQVARQCTSGVYVVTPWSDRYRSLVDPTIQFITEVPLAGAVNSQSPLKGFMQGLSYIHSTHTGLEWVLLLACDLPQLQTEIIQAWVTELKTAKPETIALLPKNPEGWWEPLCGFYRVNCLSSLEDFFEQGGRSFQQWLDDQTVQELGLSDPALLFNCNTLEDLKKLEES